jgi:hypothetical protein
MALKAALLAEAQARGRLKLLLVLQAKRDKRLSY